VIYVAFQRVNGGLAVRVTTGDNLFPYRPQYYAGSLKKRNHSLYRKKVVTGRGCHQRFQAVSDDNPLRQTNIFGSDRDFNDSKNNRNDIPGGF
jgi:hypothetical protein